MQPVQYLFEQHPSFQQIVALKTVWDWWKTEIAQSNFVSNYPDDEETGEWKIMENKITNKVTESLKLPKLLKNYLISLIRPLGFEIRKWFFHHSLVDDKPSVLTLPEKLCWTPIGKVDHHKTAELIVKDEKVDLETRYKLACRYCFVDQIHILWQRIPEIRKESFYSHHEVDNLQIYWEPRHFCKDLVIFWTHTINNEVGKLDQLLQTKFRYLLRYPEHSSRRFAFECAVLGANVSASKFLFKELHPEEKSQEKLLACVRNLLGPSIYHSCKMETVFFLLEQLSPEQVEQVFENHVHLVLECMLHWPYQVFFLETAQKWSHFLPNKPDFYLILFAIISDKIKREEKDYDYEELFRQFYQLGCATSYSIFQNVSIFLIIIELYEEAKAAELVMHILNQGTDFQKEQLIYVKEKEEDHLSMLIKLEKWNFLKLLLIDEGVGIVTSKEIILKFKINVELQQSREENPDSKAKLTKALRLLDDVI